jgi:tRNA uridine 5-carboxymethylaminomethyl modification enzyme
MIMPENDLLDGMPGLSKEIQQKIKRYKPATIADAMLIPGITPAAISLLVLAIKKPELVRNDKNT